MPKKNDSIKSDEQLALERYTSEHTKMSNDMRKKMNKASLRHDMVCGTFGGAVLGLLLAVLIAPATSKVPLQDPRTGRVKEYKPDYKRLARTTLATIVTAILGALTCYGVKYTSDRKYNRLMSDKLSNSVLRNYFEKTFKKYNDDPMQSRSVCAAALILNNLDSMERARLRALALTGMKQNDDGFYTVAETNINTATQIIANFIQYNPEVERNVLIILNGGRPDTYFLNGANQKIK